VLTILCYYYLASLNCGYWGIRSAAMMRVMKMMSRAFFSRHIILPPFITYQ
jgi:hypothetical protein